MFTAKLIQNMIYASLSNLKMMKNTSKLELVMKDLSIEIYKGNEDFSQDSCLSTMSFPPRKIGNRVIKNSWVFILTSSCYGIRNICRERIHK